MFPNPQCPFCGRQFDTVNDVALHLDSQHCQVVLRQETSPQKEQENADPISHYEAADPVTSTVEDAG
ncbi:MAG TPA: hypothetical protein VJZ27_20415 [Aggregatilineales bacterium]|nr:hypothetical protein [Aggregatilineales bacterium]